VVTTRESDGAIPALNRAEAANHVGAAACITLHATTSGSGVHLFTSSLTQIPITRFLPWETAQGAYAEQSLRLSSEIDTAMTHAEIPVTLGRTALQPLDSFTCPAVVAELSPLHGTATVTQLSDPAYQDRIVAAMAAAVEQWQHDWRQQP
jgi:N-acetylmuramoyl-L-alanine amidase